jgi:hypothetical protein
MQQLEQHNDGIPTVNDTTRLNYLAGQTDVL